MKPTQIYVLLDPTTQEVRYVGKTVNLPKRIDMHKYTKASTHTARWIKSLSVFPTLHIIDTVYQDWAESEQFWIAYFKFLGADLTNHTTGGEGTCGWKHSQQTKDKIISSNLGRIHPPEIREKIKRARATQIITPEHGAKISAALKGVPKSKEHAAKVGLAHRGRKHTPEAIEKMRVSHRNAPPVSMETRKKIGDAHRGRKDKPESHQQTWATRRARGGVSESFKKVWERRSPEERSALAHKVYLSRKSDPIKYEAAREKHRIAATGVKPSEESKAKNAEAKRLWWARMTLEERMAHGAKIKASREANKKVKEK